VAGRPVLTTARAGPLGSSAGVDRSVRQLVADALAVDEVDAELLAALAPDVIVTQGLCRVCAVGLDDVQAAVARLAAKADVALVSPYPRRLGDILGVAQPGVQSLGDGRQARVEGPSGTGWSATVREIGVRSSSNVDRSAPPSELVLRAGWLCVGSRQEVVMSGS
jgi:hypothetical protein